MRYGLMAVFLFITLLGWWVLGQAQEKVSGICFSVTLEPTYQIICLIDYASNYMRGPTYQSLSCDEFACTLRHLAEQQSTDTSLYVGGGIENQEKALMCWGLDPCGEANISRLWEVLCEVS